jgi:hypothetical protein
MSGYGILAAERARPRTVVVLAAVGSALLVNLAVYAVGRAAGGSFSFSAASGPSEVDAVTVGGFTVVPFLLGLTLAALLARRWPRVLDLALVVAPVLALGTVALMTLPADLDRVSTIALGACHVVLAVIAVAALLRLRRLARPAGTGR